MIRITIRRLPTAMAATPALATVAVEPERAQASGPLQ